MAPHKDPEDPPSIVRLPPPEKPPMSQSPPRLLIIGAGSRGNAYAKAIGTSTNGICVGVVDLIAYKRKQLGRKYIWGDNEPSEGQEFADWTRFLNYERERRQKASAGEVVPEGVDGVFICVQDELHKTVILGLEELNLHIMCEKPLATSMNDTVSIYRSLDPANNGGKPAKIFSIGHVLRYSPHNILLRKLLLEDNVIGDILSINHTEPVGWWHFSHSYVRYVPSLLNISLC
jgi:predicted dehydrogenase